MRALELNNLGAEPAGDAGAAGAGKEMTGLFRHLGDQPLLERLVLGDVPAHCQSLLGNFLGSSNTLATLHIGMDGVVAPEPLVTGFRQNTSVEKLYLNLKEMADGLLPLLVALADSGERLTHVTLTTRQGRADGEDSWHIGNLIARNDALASLAWVFDDGKGVDLARLGTALAANRRLELLTLMRQLNFVQMRSPLIEPCDWVDASMLPGFLESLKKNRTLTALVFTDSAPGVNAVPEKFPMLQQVLDRNRAWQVFACSDAYIAGAVQGLFTNLDMPVDTALVTADYLLRHKPRVAAGALALVNKASYYSAVAGRRDAHPAMLDQRLPGRPDSEGSGEDPVDDLMERYAGHIADMHDSSFEDMIALLNGIIASRDDYSEDDLRRITKGPLLGAALVVIMNRSESNYLYLVKRFCQAAGTDVIRSRITYSIPDSCVISAQQRRLLEQSFEPDAQHLARFVNGAPDYDSIDSLPARLFVGYNMAPNPDWESGQEFTSWCMKNQAPGALMAWHDRLGSNTIEVDAKRFSSEFLEAMMEKISLLRNLTDLSIKGVFSPDDASILQRVLTADSGLLELLIDRSAGGVAFDLIMQGLMCNKGIKVVSLCNLASSRIAPICGTLAEVLNANGMIESLSIDMFSNDPELDDFEQLALNDPRLQVTFNSEEESSDSEEATFDVEE